MNRVLVVGATGYLGRFEYRSSIDRVIGFELWQRTPRNLRKSDHFWSLR